MKVYVLQWDAGHKFEVEGVTSSEEIAKEWEKGRHYYYSEYDLLETQEDYERWENE